MLLNIVQFVAGIFGLYFGGDWLVAGSGSLSRRLGISPMIVGVTVVAFGTSAPELVVSLIATAQGTAAVAVGNILGSNVANIALILGIATIIHPLGVQPKVLKGEYLFALGASVVAFLVCLDGKLQRWDGAIFLVGMALFLYWALRAVLSHRKARETSILPSPETGEETAPLPVTVAEGANSAGEGDEEAEHFSAASADVPGVSKSTGWDVVKIVGGILLLVVGAKFLVNGAVGIARFFKVPELVIGLTVVSIGTSLPELVTTAFGAVKGEDEIAIGNILGSNVFNIFAVLGTTAAILPMSVERAALVRDFPIMLGFTALLFILMRTGYSIGRFKGILLLSLYLVYIVFVYVS